MLNMQEKIQETWIERQEKSLIILTQRSVREYRANEGIGNDTQKACKQKNISGFLKEVEMHMIIWVHAWLKLAAMNGN